MTENITVPSNLASQYAAQVTTDLERNVKEQERVSAEIEALQEQLAQLQRDHAVLTNMQQALGLPAALAETAAAVAADAPVVPAPRKKTASSAARKSTAATKTGAATKSSTAAKTSAATKKTAASGKPKQTRAKKATAASGKGSGGKETARKSSAGATRTADQPTLVDLVRGHLGEVTEPRSAAEIASALGQVHPDRDIKTTVVRTTLEGLVAKGQAQRTKQGNSVFYTAPDTDNREPEAQPVTEQSE
ncbi:BlaI/MecI/CopY family transcriptional regulator [Streptomyces sp. JB150]|uniref:BlaI/MecI/CopY family transcriptional regulator n=1 Tax=Streptomyces sp. JB150 TaxID=2714844 RepID=UPI00140CC3DB|nr:BlaI/MecI/CopY family transcriptional regulator [Streptomyces sp. JB150]QIJ66267.1 BlaI/MecI/CopY family transcriptional regulator [Streptomyces sp. JB150]